MASFGSGEEMGDPETPEESQYMSCVINGVAIDIERPPVSKPREPKRTFDDSKMNDETKKKKLIERKMSNARAKKSREKAKITNWQTKMFAEKAAITIKELVQINEELNGRVKFLEQQLRELMMQQDRAPIEVYYTEVEAEVTRPEHPDPPSSSH